MNSTGCSHMMATDELLLYQLEVPGSCTASYAVWIALAVISLILKVGAVALIFKLWCRRRNKSTAPMSGSTNKNRTSKSRIPVVPIFGVIGLVAHLLFWVLAGLNIISKGHAAPLFLIVWLTFVSAWAVYILKFVSLGLGATPRLNKWNHRVTAQSSKLNRMDPLGRLLFTLGMACMCGAAISLAIVAPILTDNQKPFLVGLGFQGGLTICFGVLIDVQIRRLQRVIRETLEANSAVLTAEARGDFLGVYKKLSAQRAVALVANTPLGAAAVLIAVSVIPVPYWLIGLLFLAEAASMFLFTLANFINSSAQSRTDTSNLDSRNAVDGDGNAVGAIGSSRFSSVRDNKALPVPIIGDNL